MSDTTPVKPLLNAESVRTRWRFFKAVWGYKLRVLFDRPYKGGMTLDEFRKRYLPEEKPKVNFSCACGHMSCTIPLNGARMACCDVYAPGSGSTHNDGSACGPVGSKPPADPHTTTGSTDA